MKPGAQAGRAAAVQQQGIGSDQQHFEKHEQVEKVAGQKRTVQAHQLQLKQGMEIAAAIVGTQRGVHQAEKRHQGREGHHQRAQSVEYQHYSERCRPSTQFIDAISAVIGEPQQTETHAQQYQRGGPCNDPLAGACAAAREQQCQRGGQGKNDGDDQPMIHGSSRDGGSMPSM